MLRLYTQVHASNHCSEFRLSLTRPANRISISLKRPLVSKRWFTAMVSISCLHRQLYASLIRSYDRIFCNCILYTMQTHSPGNRDRQGNQGRHSTVLQDLQAVQVCKRPSALPEGRFIRYIARVQPSDNRHCVEQPDITFFGEPIDAAIEEQLEKLVGPRS